MELDAYQIIKAPVITEKVTGLTEFHNIYGFKVDRRANKVMIRRAVENIWDVKVLNVNTMIRKGKPRRVRSIWSKQPDAKIALVKLAEGQRIEA